jgi:hypothetical protein
VICEELELLVAAHDDCLATRVRPSESDRVMKGLARPIAVHHADPSKFTNKLVGVWPSVFQSEPPTPILPLDAFRYERFRSANLDRIRAHLGW